MSAVQVRVEIEAGDTLRITPPYMADSTFAGNPAHEVPWHIYWGPETVLVFPDATRLVELRDAITAALDAHGETS